MYSSVENTKHESLVFRVPNTAVHDLNYRTYKSTVPTHLPIVPKLKYLALSKIIIAQ